MKTMIARLTILAMIVLLAMPVKAQFGNSRHQTGVVTAPSAAFHSTGSAIMTTGSAYSANPSLNPDGTAAYKGASYSPSNMTSGPRKAPTPGDDDDEGTLPIGDAVLPLMLLACAYLILRATRRRREIEE